MTRFRPLSALARIRWIFLVAWCLSGLSGTTFGQTGDEPTLSLDQFLDLVRAWHPMARQADLRLKLGEARLLAARGGFDPKLFTVLDQKYFDDKNYYSQLDGGASLPTWFGLEFKAGLEQNRGAFLNPEGNVPPGGLMYAGVSLPLGQGLFIDQRRAALFSARIFRDATEVERRLLLNDLFFEATLAYWAWAFSEYELRIFQDALTLAEDRLVFVRGSYLGGSRAAIDTLEALLQVQMLTQEREAARLTNAQARLTLSNFLWTPDLQAYLLPANVNAPDTLTTEGYLAPAPATLATWLDRVPSDHPDMQRYDLKIAELDVDRRLRADRLKPRVDLRYNFLTEYIGENELARLSPSNYKWGLEFQFPLFLRKERGDLQMARIKLQDTGLERDRKLPEIRNKIRAYALEQENLATQIGLLSSAALNYRRLLDAERQRLENGESSLFLINQRQFQLIGAEQKLLKSKFGYHKAEVALRWALGQAMD